MIVPAKKDKVGLRGKRRLPEKEKQTSRRRPHCPLDRAVLAVCSTDKSDPTCVKNETQLDLVASDWRSGPLGVGFHFRMSSKPKTELS